MTGISRGVEEELTLNKYRVSFITLNSPGNWLQTGDTIKVVTMEIFIHIHSPFLFPFLYSSVHPSLNTRASCMVDKSSTTGLYPQPYFYFEIGS